MISWVRAGARGDAGVRLWAPGRQGGRQRRSRMRVCVGGDGEERSCRRREGVRRVALPEQQRGQGVRSDGGDGRHPAIKGGLEKEKPRPGWLGLGLGRLGQWLGLMGQGYGEGVNGCAVDIGGHGGHRYAQQRLELGGRARHRRG